MRVLLVFIFLILTGCGAKKEIIKNTSNELEKFAYANCLMWYFDLKGYDSSDLRAISGGIVEKSDISIDQFQKVALIVKDLQLDLQTKNNIDNNLLKCFNLDKSDELSKVLGN
tara:strand:+ start:95 stop:433 length:339 start_codon:yes stop_codon:yes gene_type:complete